MFKKIAAVLLVFALSVSGLYALDLNTIKIPELNKINLPQIQHVKLDNGIRIYLLEDKSLPLIQISTRVHGGTFLEPADKVGLAEICGSLMRMGGTQKWKSDEFDELIENIGGSVGASINTIAGTVDVVMLSSYKELAIEALAEVMRRPAFEETKFKQLMVSAFAGIQRRNDQPAGIASREFDKLIYGKDSVYARHSENATLRNISREDVVAFHKQVFKPENVQIAILGDFDSKAMLELVTKYFGDWKKTDEKPAEFPKVEYNYDQQLYYVDLPGVTQSNIYLGHIGGWVLDKENSDRVLINNILGLGFASRLFKEVRSKAGLAYTVYAYYGANLSYQGSFSAFASTKTESTIKAMKLIKDVIAKFKDEKVTAEELKAAKDKYLNTFVFNFDTKAKILERLVYYDFFGLPEDFLNKQMEEVKKATPESIQAAAQKYLHPDKFRMLLVGSVKDFGGSLESLENGKPQALDITIAK